MPVSVEIQVPRRGLWPRTTYRRVLPASFNEVEEARRLPLWRALLSGEGEAGRMAALRLLLRLPGSVRRALDADQVAALLAALPWLQAKPRPAPPFDYFDHGGKRYFLPNAYGMNLVALEYPISDEAFTNYIRTGEADHLRLLCGTLCREEEAEPAAITQRGDRRVPLLSRPQAEARAEQLRDLDPRTMNGVLFFFAGVKEYVHNSYGKVLFEEPDTDEHGNPLPNNTKPSLGWWSVYFTVAHDGPFGDVERVYQTSFHDVCLYLVDRIRAQKEEEIRMRLASKGFGENGG